jgi:hypothetical protein
MASLSMPTATNLAEKSALKLTVASRGTIVTL